jgi:hypothetical protein
MKKVGLKKGDTTLLESKFQSNLIKEIKEMLPDCIVLKTDPNYIQGFPDLLILWRDKWASLEVKKSINAPHQPNQEYYVNVMDYMSFSRSIYPENKEEVLNAIQQSFRSKRRPLVFKPE